MQEVRKKLTYMVQRQNDYVDFEQVTFWQVVINNLSAILVIVAWMKVNELPLKPRHPV